MRICFLLFVCLGFLCSSVCLAQDTSTYATPVQKPNYDNIKVTRVIAGDILELENGEQVKLIGIDCPESTSDEKTHQGADRTGLDYYEDMFPISIGKAAKNYVKSKVEGKAVRLEFDVQKRDQYGRLLAYVYFDPKPIPYSYTVAEDVIMREEGREYWFLNAYLISTGLASLMIVPPNVKYAEVFQKLHQKFIDDTSVQVERVKIAE